jgi:hypothetical protein
MHSTFLAFSRNPGLELRSGNRNSGGSIAINSEDRVP